MSFEKVKIKAINHTPPNKQTGQVHHFLQVEISKVYDIYMNEAAMKNRNIYESLKDQECLLPLALGVRNNQTQYSFEGDAQPIPLTTMPVLNTVDPQDEQLKAVESSAPKVSKENNAPLFGKKAG